MISSPKTDADASQQEAARKGTHVYSDSRWKEAAQRYSDTQRMISSSTQRGDDSTSSPAEGADSQQEAAHKGTLREAISKVMYREAAEYVNRDPRMPDIAIDALGRVLYERPSELNDPAYVDDPKGKKLERSPQPPTDWGNPNWGKDKDKKS